MVTGRLNVKSNKKPDVTDFGFYKNDSETYKILKMDLGSWSW